MKIVKPDKFFYIDGKELNIRVKISLIYTILITKFNIFIQSYFKKVVVVKYENFKI